MEVDANTTEHVDQQATVQEPVVENDVVAPTEEKTTTTAAAIVVEEDNDEGAGTFGEKQQQQQQQQTEPLTPIKTNIPTLTIPTNETAAPPVAVTPSPKAAAKAAKVVNTASSPRNPDRSPPTNSLSFGRGTPKKKKPVLVSPGGSRSLSPSVRTGGGRRRLNFQQQKGGGAFASLSMRYAGLEGNTTIASTAAATILDKNLNKNPLKTDPKLKDMLERLDDINSYRPFKLWKSSFLNRFEEFLDDTGAVAAQEAYTSFQQSLKFFAKFVKQVQMFVEKGDLTVERTSVKGRNSLNEMNKWLVQVILEETDLVPARTEDEKRRGYTKFHLGAVLVRDGFREYAQLHDCCDILRSLKANSLQGVADKQQLEEIDNFDRQMVRFRDLMADLGLHDVMLKCWQLSEPEDEFIFVDLKTGTMGAIDVKVCLERLLVHTIKSEQGQVISYREAISDLEDREAVLMELRDLLEIKT